jgi:hypothetical protein
VARPISPPFAATCVDTNGFFFATLFGPISEQFPARVPPSRRALHLGRPRTTGERDSAEHAPSPFAQGTLRASAGAIPASPSAQRAPAAPVLVVTSRKVRELSTATNSPTVPNKHCCSNYSATQLHNVYPLRAAQPTRSPRSRTRARTTTREILGRENVGTQAISRPSNDHANNRSSSSAEKMPEGTIRQVGR